MKRADWLLRLHGVILAVIVVFMPVHTFLATWGGTAIGPLLVWKSWKEILLAMLLPFTVWLLARRPDIARILWQRLANKLILIYIVLHVMLALASPAATNAVFAGLAMNLRFLAVFMVAQIVVAGSPKLSGWFQRVAPWWLVGAAVGVSLLAIVQIAWLPGDFLSAFGYDKTQTVAPHVLVDENPDALRAFATLNGPNDLGAFLLLPLCVVAGMLVAGARRSLLWSALLAIGMGLLLTGSRSAWLGALTALAVLAITLIPRRRLIPIVTWGALPTIAILAFGLWLATTVPALRLAVFHSSPGDPSLFEGSTEAHWQSAVLGVHNALAHPLGQGVGVAGPASYYNSVPLIPENYYLQVAIEVGLFGLALFLLICALVAIDFWRKRQAFLPRALLGSFIGLGIVNLFLHGWADDSVALTWWAAAGLVFGTKGEVREPGTPHKKTA